MHSIGLLPLVLVQLVVLLTTCITLAFPGKAAGRADTAIGAIACPFMQTLPTGAPAGHGLPIATLLPAGALIRLELES
jgi:hypothetical protein